MTFVKEKENFKIKLGRRIRQKREEQGISLKTFEVIEPSIDRHQMSRIEMGKLVPSAYTLFKISRGIGIPIAELLHNIESEI